MPATDKIALGLDFGTESVRALLVDLQGRGASVGCERLRAWSDYRYATGKRRKTSS